jgi:sugar phosphate isomerase/epimerase
MTWRLGLASGVCLHRPLTEILGALADSGAEGIEVGTPPGHFHPEVAAEVESVRDELGRLSLEAVSVHAPFGRAMDLAATSVDVRARGVTAVNAATTAIERLGGQLVVVHPSDLERHGEDVEARLWAALDSLQSRWRSRRPSPISSADTRRNFDGSSRGCRTR